MRRDICSMSVDIEAQVIINLMHKSKFAIQVDEKEKQIVTENSVV